MTTPVTEQEIRAYTEAVGKALGKVEVDMGETACKEPDAGEYIRKIQARGSIGKKRKTVKC